MSDLNLKKEHIWFTEKNSQLLRDYADRTNTNVTHAANKLISMIAKMEEKIEVTLKQTEIEVKENKKPLRFRKNMSFSIKI
ncbi:MAG: hypothetical protein H3C35_03665 [Bacteroidetes bacterium]|nr:hypothetical protein [Bacteroidota bacterium]